MKLSLKSSKESLESKSDATFFKWIISLGDIGNNCSAKSNRDAGIDSRRTHYIHCGSKILAIVASGNTQIDIVAE